MALRPGPTPIRDPLAHVRDEGKSTAPEMSAPSMQQTIDIPYQSFLSSTLFERAIQVQPPSDGIIQSTIVPGLGDITCFGIGLAPWSQSVAACRFKAGGQKTGSNPYIITPGQIIRPHGVLAGQKFNASSGVDIGCPMGWLGGGPVTFVVLQTPDAEVYWPSSDNDILLQRFRTIVKNGGIALPAISDTAGLYYNWPGGFPWTGSRNLRSFPQVGKTAGMFNPTKTVFRFRSTVLVGGEAFTVVMRGSDDMDTDSAGVVDTTVVTDVLDMNTPGPVALASFPTVEIVGGALNRMNGNQCRIDIMSTNVSLIGLFVDVFRYGRVA